MNEKKVYLRQFKREDDTATFAAAMAYLRENPFTTLVVEPGTYTITTPLAREAQQKVMSGEWGRNPQHVMFKPDYVYSKGIDFASQTGTRFEAYGATFMIDGFMEPVSVTDCRDVELCGFTIDHVRKPYTRGVVTELGEADAEGCVEALITLDQPVEKLSPHIIKFKIVNPKSHLNMPCDLVDYRVEYVDEYHYRGKFTNAPEMFLGVEVYCGHTLHSRPAVYIGNSVNTKVTDVTVHSQPGMGFCGNRNHNITLSRVNVVPSIGHHFSTNTDATHFTSTTGLIRLEYCTFDGQGDDFANIHSYYHAIVEREADNICYMQEKTPDGTHDQTLDYPDVGDTLELSDRETMVTVDKYKVLDCTPMPEKWMCRVILDHALPENTEAYCLADVTRIPKVEIVGCHARSHHARSILIKTRDVLIENNTFENVVGPGIFIAPEASWWEGVSPEDVIIRRNRIIDCGRKWGCGMMIMGGTTGQAMKNIIIEDNVVDCPNTKFGILVANTAGVKIARNKVNVQLSDIIQYECTDIESDVPVETTHLRSFWL